MSSAVLFWLLLRATLFSFSGFGSLPLIREDLVIQRHVISDEQLNRAVLVARTTPGPMGTYLVAVGYEAAGIKGAMAGWLAMAAPALLVIPLLWMISAVAEHPRAVNALRSLILASAVLLVASSIPLAADLIERFHNPL